MKREAMMEWKRQAGKSQGASASVCQAGPPINYCSPPIGLMKWRRFCKTYLEVKDNYWQRWNIFINNVNKNIPHFQFCFNLVLGSMPISCLDGYYIRPPSASGSSLPHLWLSDIICVLQEGEEGNPTWSLKSPSLPITAAHPAATVLWYPTFLKCHFLIPFYVSIFLGH